MLDNGFGAIQSYSSTSLEARSAGTEIQAEVSGENGGLLHAVAFLWSDNRGVDVDLSYAEPL